jgi:hypothetical protein
MENKIKTPISCIKNMEFSFDYLFTYWDEKIIKKKKTTVQLKIYKPKNKNLQTKN